MWFNPCDGFGRFARKIIPAAILLLFFFGCASRSTAPPEAPAQPTEAGVTSTGYTIQLGAFAAPENAVRLCDSLRAMGFDVYYFPHESGLFKVRLGDFTTRDGARQEASRLFDRGIVDNFYIVGPEDYSLTRSGILGKDPLRAEILETAERFIGLPYQWGGSSPETGFDCSGLTMAVYQLNGINLPHSSRGQFQAGRTVSRETLAKGDLVFFSVRNDQKVNHVGIYRGDGTFIHSPGQGQTIRVDVLSSAYFKHRFTGGRTYL